MQSTLLLSQSNQGFQKTRISKSKEDVKIAIDAFEEQVRKNSLFFAWREGESIVPEAVTGKENKSLRRIFLETQIILIGVHERGNFAVPGH